MSTIRELRQMGKQRGIKYASKMNSATLYELLGIPLVRNQTFDKYNKDKIKKPVGILFVNKETQETQKFVSIYKAAKYININPSCIPYYIRKEKEIIIGTDTFLVKRA